MVLCCQVYCSNCILKSVLLKDRIHISIRNKKDSKSSGKQTHLKQLWAEGLSSCATTLTKEGHAG